MAWWGSQRASLVPFLGGQSYCRKFLAGMGDIHPHESSLTNITFAELWLHASP